MSCILALRKGCISRREASSVFGTSNQPGKQLVPVKITGDEARNFLYRLADAEAEAEKMATQYGMEKAEFLAEFGGLDVVKYDMRMHKALELLSE